MNRVNVVIIGYNSLVYLDHTTQKHGTCFGGIGLQVVNQVLVHYTSQVEWTDKHTNACEHKQIHKLMHYQIYTNTQEYTKLIVTHVCK